MRIFTRSKHVTCDHTEGGLLVTRSGLIDTVHEIEVIITTDIDKKEIIEATASIIRAPYTICAGAAERARGLAGLKIEEARISVKITDILGGPQGCFHLVDLTLEAIKAIKQSLFSFITGEREEKLRTFDGILHGTCFAHSHSVEVKIKTHIASNVIAGHQ
ncbi:MAG: DUF2889 domain-containing protein [Desulfocucumaceae bacterium]